MGKWTNIEKIHIANVHVKNFFFSFHYQPQKCTLKHWWNNIFLSDWEHFLKISSSQCQQESSEAGFPHTLLAGMHICTPFLEGSWTPPPHCTVLNAAAAAAKSLQSCPTLCDPIDGSPPGSAVLGILRERTLEWDAISFSNAWKWKVKVKSLSRVWLLATPGTAAHQALPSRGFSRQEYWSRVPLPSLQLAIREL